jgi:pimeloyl-ACP methyl ester carboxylesterase
VEAVMNDFVTKDHTIDGVRVQVLEAGAGEPVVYLHAERVPEHPSVDLFTIPADKKGYYMFAVPPPPPAPPPHLPEGLPVGEMMIARYREMTSLARFMWERNYEPKLERWLKHIKAPVLLLWGEQDRVVPVQQAQHWATRLGGSTEIPTFAGAGHVLWHEATPAIGRMTRSFQSS